jgi:hypothetical protein
MRSIGPRLEGDTGSAVVRKPTSEVSNPQLPDRNSFFCPRHLLNYRFLSARKQK